MVVVVLISMRVEILAAVRVRNISKNLCHPRRWNAKKFMFAVGTKLAVRKKLAVQLKLAVLIHTLCSLLFGWEMGNENQRGYPENRINGGLCSRSGELTIIVCSQFGGVLFFVQATRLSRDGKKTSFMVPHRAVSFMLSCSLDGPSAHPPSCRDRDLIYIFALEIT